MSSGEGLLVLAVSLVVYGVLWGVPVVLLVLIYRKLSRIEELQQRS